LSEKICFHSIEIKKKIVIKTKRIFVYGQLILPLSNVLIPTQAISLPILPTPSIMKFIDSNCDFSKQAIIAQVTQQMSPGIDFTQREIDQFYYFSIECKNNFISKEELITKISNLRDGNIDISYIIAALILICNIIILLRNKILELALKPNPNAFIPPHLQLFHGDQKPKTNSGYSNGAGPRTLTVTELTKNSRSEKKDPSFNSWDYREIIRELYRQSSKKKLE
jgi:hypothetical protein